MPKKILLIGLPYHHYTAEIIAAMRAQGHEVVFHDIQPRDLLMKSLRVAARGWYQRRLDAHHRRIKAAERGRRCPPPSDAGISRKGVSTGFSPASRGLAADGAACS